MKTEELFKFIKERHSIYEKKKTDRPKPWTDDPILQKYKFCNVYRELDRVSVWISENWRTPNEEDPNLWFAMAIARYINWPETLEQIKYPTVKYWRDAVANTLRLRKADGLQVYSGAYMISTHGNKISKDQYLLQIFDTLWEKRKELAWKNFSSLEEFHSALKETYGVGSFMAAQIIADVKYTVPYLSAPDWWTFAASGPGSRRGLNRVYEFDKDHPWQEENWKAGLFLLKKEIDPLLKKNKMPKMHAQDLQNCLCEFDKYERVRLGEGRPKSTYSGGA